MCVVVLSNRDMFEKTLPAHLATTNTAEDPVDSCTKYFITRVIHDVAAEQGLGLSP